MNTAYTECKRCRWDYIQEFSFVRMQPWTDDDAGMMFQTCVRCGKISIQHFAADGTVSGFWMLHPDAIVIFRAGTAPSHVFDYVFSDDFLKNRGITRALFRGYLKSMLDLAGAINVLITRMGKSDSLDRVELCMELLRDLLAEYVKRADEDAEDSRLAVSSLHPIVELLRDERPLEGNIAASRVELRFTALEILETFVQPAMWKSVPTSETQELEEALDHMKMVDESIARLNYLAQQVDDQAILDGYVEARFMYRVFRRRKARLSRAHSDAVWRLMHALKDAYTLGSPLDLATKTYEALRALLEHQLVESGFFKLGQRNQNGTACLAFRSPKTGEMLLVPLWYPKLAIFATDRAKQPTVVLDSWTEAITRL